MNNRHLFLTSSGLTKGMINSFFDIIRKCPEEVKILYIPTAGIKTDSAREGIAICLYELSLMGICSENIFVYNLELVLSKGYQRTYSAYVTEEPIVSRLMSMEELKRFDAVFVGGGDSAVLCREMNRTGFDYVIKEAVNAGLVYVGIRACLKNHSHHLHAPLCVIFTPNSGYIARYAPFIWCKSLTNCDAHLTESIFQTCSSAGSMYAAGNLENGLNIISNSIMPHWNGEKLKSLSIDHGEIQLADGQAVYIEGDSICII